MDFGIAANKVDARWNRNFGSSAANGNGTNQHSVERVYSIKGSFGCKNVDFTFRSAY